MYQVGTGAGEAWKFQEGQGEASIIKTPLTDQFMYQRALMNEQERRAKKAKDEEDFQKRVDILNESYAKSDFDVNTTVRQAQMQFLDEAAKYRMETGKNPFLASNTDPKAVEFQQKYQELYTMPTRAKAVADHMKEQATMYANSPAKFDDDDNVKAIMDGAKGENLVDIVMGKKQLPQLKVTAPRADITLGIKSQLDAIGIKAGDTEKFYEIGDNIPAAMLAGPDGKAYQASAKQIIGKMSDQHRNQLNAEATAKGMTPEEYYIYSNVEDNVVSGINAYRLLFDSYEKARALTGSIVDKAGVTKPDIEKGINTAITEVKKNWKLWEKLVKEYGSEDKVREAYKQFSWGDQGSKWKQTGGQNFNDLSGATYRDWVSFLVEGDSTAQGLAGNMEVSYITTDPVANTTKAYTGKLRKVEFAGVQGSPDWPVYSWEVQPPKAGTRLFRINIVNKNSATGKETVFTKVVPEDELNQIAAAPITQYLNQKQGQRQFAANAAAQSYDNM